MRIKKQISLLIITLLVLHLACIILFPMFYYMQTSDSDLMKKYRDARQRNPSVLSEKSWNQIQKFIESKPHDLEVLVILYPKCSYILIINPEQSIPFVKLVPPYTYGLPTN